jgi:hypothetical protein
VRDLANALCIAAVTTACALSETGKRRANLAEALVANKRGWALSGLTVGCMPRAGNNSTAQARGTATRIWYRLSPTWAVPVLRASHIHGTQ